MVTRIGENRSTVCNYHGAWREIIDYDTMGQITKDTR
jgi:hypothetical protein